jgi:hypothetical protein
MCCKPDSHKVCVDKSRWEPTLKAKSESESNSVVPLFKLRLLVMYHGMIIAINDKGEDFDKIYRDFYTRENTDIGLIEYLNEKKIEILDVVSVDNLDYYQKMHVAELRKKLALYEKKHSFPHEMRSDSPGSPCQV